MAESASLSPKPMQPANPIDPISQNQVSSANPPIPSPSPSIDLPQISSPPLPPLHQSQSQPQQIISGLNYPMQQTLQRSPSMSRINQKQSQTQQQQKPMMMRQQTGIYGQMNFGGSAIQQAQNQQQMGAGAAGGGAGGNLQRSAMIGQTGHFPPMLSGQAATAAAVAQFNLLASVRVDSFVFFFFLGFSH